MHTTHEVVICGAGPTGLMLAGELALAGIDVVIVERRDNQDLAGIRAGGLHARSIEVMDQRGIADRFLAEGQVAQVVGFAGVSLDISDFPTRHNHGLGLWQNRIERILADWVGELGVRIEYGSEVLGFCQDASGVVVELTDGRSLCAHYLVGCDGGRSFIRKTAGIAFPGWDATTSSLIAQVEMAEEPRLGIHQDASGKHALGRVDYEVRDGQIVYATTGPVSVMLTEKAAGGPDEPTLHDLRAALVAVYGTDFGAHSPTWISRFTDAARQAESYRAGRVLLAGDAAHVHAPDGGQGLNTGVQDAVNLGWKLAQVVRGTSPESLLDTYHAERHPVGARVLRNTMAAVALRRGDDRTSCVRQTIAELLGIDGARKHIAAELSGLGIRYDLGEGHPLLGRRMPDLDLVVENGPTRLFSLMHRARPLLMQFDGQAPIEVAEWSDRVENVEADYDGRWLLPVVGEVAAPTAVLVRPDGYVAWVATHGGSGLREALTTWFGSPRPMGHRGTADPHAG